MKLFKLNRQLNGVSLFIPLPGLLRGHYGSRGNETWTDMLAKGGTNCLLWVSTADTWSAVGSYGVTLTETYLQPNYIKS